MKKHLIPDFGTKNNLPTKNLSFMVFSYLPIQLKVDKYIPNNFFIR